MCDLTHAHDHHQPYGFLVDTPQLRALIDETQRLTVEIPDVAARVEALRPAFEALLTSDGWLPDSCATPDETSKMGGGIGQYALYRAEDQSLCLFSLVVPLLPPADDIHYVSTISDTPSISIHLFANDTACVWRHTFEPATGVVTPFRSGYANAPCPPDL